MKQFILSLFFLATSVMLFGQEEQCLFRTQPQDTETCLNGLAVFDAGVDTLFFENSFFFEWQYKPSGASDWIPVQNNATFQVTNTQLRSMLTVTINGDASLDGADFRCSVSDLYFSETANLVIHTLPVVSFTSQNYCFGDITGFANTSPDAASMKSWAWEFSDGSKYISRDINHRFLLPGDYKVKLTLTNPSDCEAADSAVVTILPLPEPVIQYTKDVFCGFESNLTFYTGDIFESYLWEIRGANNVLASEETEITFDCDENFPAGQYEVILTVTDANGCSADVRKSFLVLISQAPVDGTVLQKENDSRLLVLLIDHQENSDFLWMKMDPVTKTVLEQYRTKEPYHLFGEPIDKNSFEYGVEVIPPFSDCSAVFYLH
jgi:PKD repeat protein